MKVNKKRIFTAAAINTVIAAIVLVMNVIAVAV